MICRTARAFRELDPVSFDRPAQATGVLMCSPEHFAVVDVRNVHMEGQEGAVDAAAARAEWETLVSAIEGLGLRVFVLPPVPGLVDMVFTANPSLLGVDRDGRTFSILSRMQHPGRREETAHHAAWLHEQGIPTVEIPAEVGGRWEGGGDSLWHPDRYFVWGGVGQRSSAAVFEALSDRLGLPIALVTLVDPAFYHLDTCLMPLDATTALWVPGAFDETGRELLAAAFPRLIEADAAEARTRLACNPYCPDRRTVLLPSGSPKTRARLEDAGFEVVDVATDEYLKSGGSVFCMRQEVAGRIGTSP